MDKQTKLELRRTIIALTGALAGFLMLYLVAHFDILLAAGAALAIYAGIYLLTKPILHIGEHEVDSIVGGAEAAGLLENAYATCVKISAVNDKIREPEYRRRVNDLLTSAKLLLDYLQRNPNKIMKARKFLTYQLDTALETIGDYHAIANIYLADAKMQDVETRSKNIVDILNTSFREQLELFLKDKIMNIDIQHEILTEKIKAEQSIEITYEE